MKRCFIMFFIPFLILCGCFSKNNNASYPEFFSPIIEELENSRDVYLQTIAPPISTWWDTGISGSGKYADTEFICHINGESYSFACNDFPPNADNCSWEVIGIFPDEATSKTFVIFHHFSIASTACEHPTLILLEFFNDDPNKYTITPYESSARFNWFHICYRIENNIYIAAADNNFGSINLNTHTLSYCEEEYYFTNDLVLQYYAQLPYHMCQFRATLQQDDIIVYSAFISEAYDVIPIGLISVAYENAQPIAYMFIDLTTENLRNKLEIIHIN